MNELISIKNQSGKESVSARELYEFLGFDSGNWTRWAKQNIEDNPFAESGEDYMGFLTMRNGNETKDFALTIDFAKRLAMMAKTEKGEQARCYFIECETKLKQTFTIPTTFSEALMLAAKQAEQIEHQHAEIIHLNKTKAQISNRQTATAMATASVLSRENKALKEELLVNTEYATIRSVCKKTKHKAKDFNPRVMKEASAELGYDVLKVKDPLYGEVNTYHKDIWEVCYNIEI